MTDDLPEGVHEAGLGESEIGIPHHISETFILIYFLFIYLLSVHITKY